MHIIKKILFKIFIIFFIIECLFQLLLYANLSSPLLFFNPYCDQEYWNSIKHKPKLSSSIETHDILSFKRIDTIIPETLNNTMINQNNSEVALYGSSFFDHSIFKDNFKRIKLRTINYSLSSYGIDQIYLSYKLTAKNHLKNIIIIGFLLEDIDRAIFTKRDYPKIKLKLINDQLILSNFPIQDSSLNNYYSILTIQFFKNITELVLNDFNFRYSSCKIDKKKKVFEKIIKNLKDDTTENNQRLIIVTFNFLNSFKNKNTWRYDFVKKILKRENIEHIDTYKIINNFSKKNNIKYEKFFNKKDFHYNQKGFELTTNAIKSNL